MIERANQADPAAGPARPRSRRPRSPCRRPIRPGRAGVVYALVGILIVVGWLVLCMYLRRVF